MNKKTFIITLFVVIIVLFYSLGMAVENVLDKPVLIWRDAETKQILFTSKDIVEYDWEKQVFLLKFDAVIDFLAWIPPHKYLARKLIVEDANGIIYNANWVSNVSSIVYQGPIYYALSPNPLFSITNSYPPRGEAGRQNNDIRFSQRLRAGLEKAEILKSIDVNHDFSPLAIRTIHIEWKDISDDLKIRLEYFEDTFRIGQKARAHVFFAGGENIKKQIDSIALFIKFTANNGRFVSETTISEIPVSAIDAGIYSCKFDPWYPVAGSDRNPEYGQGFVTMSVLLQKKDGQNKTTVRRLDFEEKNVPVNAMIKTEYYSPTYREQLPR